MKPLEYQKGDDALPEQRKQKRMNLFGLNRGDVWNALAQEIGGKFTKGDFWKGRDTVVAEVGPWQIVLDHYVVWTGKVAIPFTRMRTPYVNADGFRFSIRRRNFLDGIAELIGFDDVQIGDPEFDKAFTIKGNNVEKLRQLFANPRLRELMSIQDPLRLMVRDDEGLFRQKFPDGVDELYFSVSGTIKDIERLKYLFDLFAETLQTLCQIGSANENDPGIELG